MSNPIRSLRVEHLNLVHDDYDATVEHYRKLFGGVVVFDRLQPTWHGCLMDVGGVLFEIFVPNEFFLHTRDGPHYLGVEYQVADMAAVRETLAARGIRIARDLDVAVHAHAADCHGVSLKFFDDSFHDNEELLDRPMPAATYWRDDTRWGSPGCGATRWRCTTWRTCSTTSGPSSTQEVHDERVVRPPGRRGSGCSWAVRYSSWSRPTATDRCSSTCWTRRRHPVDRVRRRDLDRARVVLRRARHRPGARHRPDTFAIPAEHEPRRDLRVRRPSPERGGYSNRPKKRVSMLARGTGSRTVRSANDTWSEAGASARR